MSTSWRSGSASPAESAWWFQAHFGSISRPNGILRIRSKLMGTGAEETERSEATSPSHDELHWVLRGILPGDKTRTVLRGQRLVIGRDEHAEVRLTHSRVSRQHAELHRQGPIFALRDLGSTNGSYAN